MTTTQLAERYRLDPLLQLMPVPRFRLPTITMDVPLALIKADPAGADVSDANRRILEGLRIALQKHELALDDVEWDRFASAVRTSGVQLATRFGLASVENRLEFLGTEGWLMANSLLDEEPTRSAIRHDKTESAADEVANVIRNIALSIVVESNTTELGIEVEANSAYLQELDKASLLRLTLNLAEHGVEWAIAGDQTPPRLRPE